MLPSSFYNMRKLRQCNFFSGDGHTVSGRTEILPSSLIFITLGFLRNSWDSNPGKSYITEFKSQALFRCLLWFRCCGWWCWCLRQRLTVGPRLALHSRSSCPNLLSAGIALVCHHFEFRNIFLSVPPFSGATMPQYSHELLLAIVVSVCFRPHTAGYFGKSLLSISPRVYNLKPCCSSRQTGIQMGSFLERARDWTRPVNWESSLDPLLAPHCSICSTRI